MQAEGRADSLLSAYPSAILSYLLQLLWSEVNLVPQTWGKYINLVNKSFSWAMGLYSYLESYNCR
jgi:hypothetical protein